MAPGADTGIHSGGFEISEMENYTKKKKGRLSIKNYILKIRPNSNVFNGFS